MRYIKKGNTPISSIGVGAMRLKDLSQDQVYACIDTALNHGINFFDHADIYGKGKSEEIFGHVLHQHPNLRDKMFIQSKCAIHNGIYDFSKEHILQSVDGILERLQTDHLDSLLLHRPDVLMDIDEVAQAFDILEQSGKVKEFGVSNMNRFQMEYLQSGLSQKLWTNQVQMSLAHTPMIDAGFNVNMHKGIMKEAGTLEYAKINQMSLQVWSPLQIDLEKGTFLNHPDYQELNEMLEKLANEYQVTKDTIAYAWLLRIYPNIQIIIGTTKPERTLHAAKATEIKLTRQQWYALYKAAGNTLP